jgi:nucleotide-binding universal stress UspA family protein
MGEQKRILVGVDGSEASQRAAALACDIARGLGARVTLACCMPPVYVPPEAEFHAEYVSAVQKANKDWGDGVLRDTREKLGASAVPVDGLLLDGDPARVIAELAREPDVVIVAVGSRNRGAMSRVLLGSVSNRVVHICEKPVLVVH